ncbi:hypothetical protein RB595_008787 [Gaeumannomyces hyphopodioides]
MSFPQPLPGPLRQAARTFSQLTPPVRSGAQQHRAAAIPRRPSASTSSSTPSRPGRHAPTKRYGSQQPPKPPGAPQPTPTSPPPQQRLARVLDRLPRPLRPYASRLRSAPLSHAAAFLVLHELTAVVPLLGLFALFHYTDLHVAPVAWVAARYGPYVDEGLGRFERYFRRKGWFGLGPGEGEKGEVQGGAAPGPDRVAALQGAQGPYRAVVEIALAYAITKALLPLRIAASVWATPWFAGVLVRTRALLSSWRKRQ